MAQLHLLDTPLDLFEGEAVAAFFFADERPPRGPAALLDWRLNGQLTDLLLQERVSGGAGDHVLVRSNGKIGATWALFVGGGCRSGAGEASFRNLLRHLLETCRRAGFVRVALGLGVPGGISASKLQSVARETIGEIVNGNLDCHLHITDDSSRLV